MSLQQSFVRSAVARTLRYVGSFALVLAASSSATSAPVTWTGTGANPTFWDVGTTLNWTNGGAVVFNDGDVATFNDTGTTTTIAVQGTVSPGGVFVNTATNQFTFSGGNIAGGGVLDFSGTQAANFTQENLSFTGGTTVNNVRVDFRPAAGGAHSFGTGAITLNSGGNTWFNFDPDTVGATLTNDFIVNGSVTWRNVGSELFSGSEIPLNWGTSGVRTGDVYLNGTLSLLIGNTSLPNNCVGAGCMATNLSENVILTGDRTIIGGERFYERATTISGDIGHDGFGPYDITLAHRGDNPDWEFFISDTNVSDPNGWDVQNIRRASSSVSSANGTVVFRVDETTFFNNMTSNGGSLFLAAGGMRFHDEFEGNGNSTTANINFSMIVEPSALSQGTGFRRNNLFNVLNGGSLGGNGIYRSGVETSGAVSPFNNALDVSVFAGGTISPGNPEVNGGLGIMTIQGDLTFVDGGELRIQVNGADTPGVDYDQLLLTVASGAGGGGVGSGFNNANLVVDFDPSLTITELAGKTLTILTADAGLNDLGFASITNNNLNEFVLYDVVFSGNSILLTNFQALVPEPGTWSLMCLGFVAIHRSRRRRAANKRS